MAPKEQERLVELIAELDGPAGEAAAEALLRLPGALQQVALTYYQTTDQRRRAVLLRCLGRFRRPGALVTLADGLKDTDDQVWRACVPGIADLASVEAHTVDESFEADQARGVLERMCAALAAPNEGETKRRYLAGILDGLPPIRRRGLLYIEPTGPATALPLIDTTTRQLTAALRHATRSPWFTCGVHMCICGAFSQPYDLILPKHFTNTLCLHYVAHHRDEVPLDELQEVAGLGVGEAKPTRAEFAGRLQWRRPRNPKRGR